ncbi:MAG TPA: hypothetical protein VME68_14110 [Acidobacteriaceae bacterium]|nr:hypothetical protein [Acidobacteriaceae bacterium]
MSKLPATAVARESMTMLSELLLSTGRQDQAWPVAAAARAMTAAQFEEFLALAGANHVIVRGLEVFRGIMLAGQDEERAEWAAAALAAERSRIAAAIRSLAEVCDAFQAASLDVTVMKSLDHWPDMGNDLDLYTNASPRAVCDLMTGRFGARIADRSWGDRLANKWNFEIPGLPEPVEVHVRRLGQTGEQAVLASRIHARSRFLEVKGHTFRVPSAADRLMISTLQRMYRHFYFRLCDVVDSAALVSSGDLDFHDLRAYAQEAGIWEGVATYLVIVSDYVCQYRGTGLGLPQFVRDAARFGGNLITFRSSFLRVPILPYSAGLYRTQLAGLLRRRELHSSARLGLLPWLATAAAIGQKITGSDKGIW